MAVNNNRDWFLDNKKDCYKGKSSPCRGCY
ncbi:MAG: hypothetical protein ACFNQE_01395 [Capnocytophaga leadbetteri]